MISPVARIPMLYPRFNAHYREKKCPLCQKHTGQLYKQPGPLKELGFPTGHYAHIQCVVAARQAREQSK